MLVLPAGDVLSRKRVRNADVECLLPRRGKWFYLKVFSPAGRGWVIFEDEKNVYAAYFNDGFSEYFGSSALGRIAYALRECEVEIGKFGEKVVKLFVAMHPEVLVEGIREVYEAFMEARLLDAIDAATGRINVGMFTEEWEEGLVEEVSDGGERKEVAESAGEEATETRVEATEVLREIKAEGRRWVVDFQEFVYGLKDFTGICKGRDGAFEAEVYLKNGEIVGAIVRDEDIEIRGEAALYYLDRPLEVEIVEGDFEVPEGAECVEDGRSVEALYLELDRQEKR